MRGLAEQYDVKHITSNYHEVIDDPAVDMLLLATTHALRLEFIAEAARKGKPVYVEKPMGSSTHEVGRILKVVRESGIPFCVGHNRRSAPAILDALSILNRHRAQAQLVPWRLDRNSHLRPSMPEEGQTMVLIRVNDDVLTWKPWAFEDGAILNEMSHFIDLANLFMAPRDVRRVFVQGSLRMNFTMLLEYDDGSLATLAHSAVGTLDYPKELVEITARGAMIAIDHLAEVRVMGIEGEPFRRSYPLANAQAAQPETGIEAFYAAAQQTIATRMATGNKDLFIGFPDKGHYAHLDRFASCIRGDGDSPCDALEGARATVIALKCIESCRLGLPLRFGADEYQIIAL